MDRFGLKLGMAKAAMINDGNGNHDLPLFAFSGI
jgi:hypothetical protein